RRSPVRATGGELEAANQIQILVQRQIILFGFIATMAARQNREHLHLQGRGQNGTSLDDPGSCSSSAIAASNELLCQSSTLLDRLTHEGVLPTRLAIDWQEAINLRVDLKRCASRSLSGNPRKSEVLSEEASSDEFSAHVLLAFDALNMIVFVLELLTWEQSSMA
ncbi:unnamed protein product, partial [Amoebophrya sp. A120]